MPHSIEHGSRFTDTRYLSSKSQQAIKTAAQLANCKLANADGCT